MALDVSYNRRALHESSERHRKLSLELRPHNFQTSPIASEHPLIPRPEIFSQLFKPKSQAAPSITVPNASECAVHLMLLHSLFTLRQDVLTSTYLDDAFEIKPEPRTVWRGYRPRRYQVKVKDSTFAKRREAKWPIYVKFAVLRFLHWVRKMDSALSEAESRQENMEVGVPPLDILMVWHSCLLNPKDFQTFCRRHGYEHIRNVEFPWLKIYREINSEGRSFYLSAENANSFRKLTGLDSNLQHYLTKNTKPQIARDIISDWTSPESVDGARLKFTSLCTTGNDVFFIQCCHRSDGKESILTQISSAIHRQSAFVDKMQKYLWLRSPAVLGTLERAVDRYSKFLKLFKLYPGQMLVPTLDVDLVWHTHQCSASRYQADIESYTGRFIDHNDKLGNSVLDDGMEKTRQLYRIRFGKEYSVCLCWDCEATLSTAAKLSQDQVNDKSSVEECAERVSMLVTFYRDVEKARRDNKALPVWHEEVYGRDYWC